MNELFDVEACVADLRRSMRGVKLEPDASQATRIRHRNIEANIELCRLVLTEINYGTPMVDILISLARSLADVTHNAVNNIAGAPEIEDAAIIVIKEYTRCIGMIACRAVAPMAQVPTSRVQGGRA